MVVARRLARAGNSSDLHVQSVVFFPRHCQYLGTLYDLGTMYDLGAWRRLLKYVHDFLGSGLVDSEVSFDDFPIILTD